MVFSNLVVHGCFGTGATVGSVALHNSAIDRLNQILYQLGAQVIAGWRLSSGELYCYIAGGRPIQRLIDGH